jgi:hypothetical protein
MTIQPFFLLIRDILQSYVIYTGAMTAEEVMMVIGFIVVMGFIALYGYLLDEPMFFEKIEGVIDSGSRQGGVHPPEGLIDIFGCGMSYVAVEKFQDRCPLDGQEHSLLLKL